MTKNRTPLVFFDVSIDGDPYEKLLFELFTDVAPKTAENFRALCTGEMGTGSRSGKPLHYKGSFFHRIVKGSLAEGGDFVKRDGSGGESIYGSDYPDEFPKLKHDQVGLLSMSVSNRDHLGSQFIITFKPNHSLDRKYVVFGKLVRGEEILKKIEAAGDDDGNPKVTVKIVNCGELKDGKLRNFKVGKENSSDINHLEGQKKYKQKKSSRERRKKRKKYHSSDSVSSSEESEIESSDSDTSDSETDLSSSDDSSSYDRRRKKKRSYPKDRHRRGRKRESRKKRRRRDKKTKRRSRRSSDISDSDSDSESSSSDDSIDDAKPSNDKVKALDQPKTVTRKEDLLPPVNGRARANGVDTGVVEKFQNRRPSPKKITRKSTSVSPRENNVSPRGTSKSPTKPSSQIIPRRMPVRDRSYSPVDKRLTRRVSPRMARNPRREDSQSPTRIGRSTRRSVSRSPLRRARSPSAGSISGSPDGTPKRIRRGRGFSDRFAYARRYRTPSVTRSPSRPRYGRNYRDRYSGYRMFSPKRFRSPPRRSPPRYRNRRSYSRSLSRSRSPRYRGGRRNSRSLSRSRSPAGGARAVRNERRRSRSLSRSPSKSRSSASRSPPAAAKRVSRAKSRTSSGSEEKKGLVSYDDGSP